ncbi:hypothetical protein [Seonamhaeicola marinus]|uniref:DUF4097 domain-containing protein n=1 Tax=Seonamhaeicola marinus TaxID=1912246 RepID=A0A5D0HJV3_9FLAO|nr:hypothetical protein [Seonamhaeicola marinus]TYA71568.1 hypothetical protein FUA24_18500 [Seonamhaeicola marinus]
MNRSILKLQLLMVTLFTVGSLVAQKQTKVSQSIKVNKDVAIHLNTSHCNIIFDTWNKNTVEIEAYAEGEDLTNEELQAILKGWNVDVDASSSEITISTSGSGGPNVWVERAPHSTFIDENGLVNTIVMELQHELADIPHIIMDGIDVPEFPEMPEIPELPELPKGVADVEFDYKAYKKDGEKYLEEYTKKFESVYGEDYAKKMEAWGEKFGKEWEKKYGKRIEEWAKEFEEKWNSEDFEKRMEAWGERFEKQMEQREKRNEERQKALEKAEKAREKAQEKREELREKLIKERREQRERRDKLVKERRVLVEKLVNQEGNSKVKKTIKIKLPKDAKLKVNVRHGEVEFANNIDNLEADLSHSKLIAQSINGGSTSISASYTPVYISNWNLGELNLNYAKDVELNNVKHVVLNSNSSNVVIDNLTGNAVIDCNIGDIKILKIDDAFTNLNTILQNCDAVIALPNTDCNVRYKGTRSRISHPKKESGNVTTFSTGNLSSGKSIVVNAKYSTVTMK